jgi:hypothetical protein
VRRAVHNDLGEMAEQDDIAPWTEAGQFFAVGGSALHLDADRWAVRGTSHCASLLDRPLEKNSGGSEVPFQRFHLMFDSGHFMAGVFDAEQVDVVEGFLANTQKQGSDYTTVQGKGSWCFENVRKQRGTYSDGSFSELGTGDEGGPGKGRELDGYRCVFTVDAINGRLELSRVVGDGAQGTRVFDDEGGDPFDETMWETPDEPDWVLENIPATKLTPVVCVFGHGSCRSWPTRTTMTKSAAKR